VRHTERDKWNERYRGGSYEGRDHPTALLAQWAPRLPPGRALDVACGTGRNALFLAAAGHEVDALDIAAEGLARGRETAAKRGLDIRWIEADLDSDLDAVLPRDTYDLIVWVRYINSSLMPHLLQRLRARGHLLCEQHLTTAEDVVGPRSPAFRLQPDELVSSVTDVQLLHYFEGLVTDPDGRRAALAQVVARRTD
jgi:SAM-dependent methyltransferase